MQLVTSHRRIPISSTGHQDTCWYVHLPAGGDQKECSPWSQSQALRTWNKMTGKFHAVFLIHTLIALSKTWVSQSQTKTQEGCASALEIVWCIYNTPHCTKIFLRLADDLVSV